MRRFITVILLLGATVETSWAEELPCCPLDVGDRVKLLVDDPYFSTGLPAGSCGTVLCCDPTWPNPDQLFVSWDNWTQGVNDLFSQCEQAPPPFVNNSGWWLECAQVVVDPDDCPAQPAVCGNGLCEPGEDPTNCPADCPANCCNLLPGDLVQLLVADPFSATGLPVGTCGTVVCCDTNRPGTDQTFISWQGWTSGLTPDMADPNFAAYPCFPLDPEFVMDSGWWVACDQVAYGSDQDADGVVDCLDQCPGTALGDVVDAQGCGCGQINCDDGDSCTADTCVDAVCIHTLNYDLATQCCDLATGTVTTISDNNACTTDTCDPLTGTVTYTDTTPAGQCCDPATGVLTPIDDNNVCTTDSCDPLTGTVTYTDATPAGQCCDPVTGALTAIDDGDACTTDACDALTGLVTHLLNYDTATQCCDPATGTLTAVSDNNTCTLDVCNADGTVAHTDATPAGQCCNPATGELMPIDDNDVCTTDTCDPLTGTVTYIATSPAGQCCNPATGELTVMSDNNACTLDVCNADGSVTHPDATPAGHCCDAATGVLTAIGDSDACTTDACNANGTVTHTPLANCPPSFRLTVQPEEPSNGSGTYLEGECVDIPAPPAPEGLVFAFWSGDASGSDNPVRVCLDRDKTITANYQDQPPATTTQPPSRGICGFAGPASFLSVMMGMAMMKVSFTRRRRLGRRS